jgi:hypothetical protein
MTAQAMPKLQKYIAAGTYWVSYLGTWAISLLAVLAIAAPLAQVVFDYWAPKLQGMTVKQVEAKRGKL